MPDRTSSPSSENASQEEDGPRKNKASQETDGYREKRGQGPRAGQSDELAPPPFSPEGSRVGTDRTDREDSPNGESESGSGASETEALEDPKRLAWT